jgi:hypothetical protein
MRRNPVPLGLLRSRASSNDASHLPSLANVIHEPATACFCRWNSSVNYLSPDDIRSEVELPFKARNGGNDTSQGLWPEFPTVLDTIEMLPCQ